jgi:drug/metabolite transporter (DMT)-like permease
VATAASGRAHLGIAFVLGGTAAIAGMDALVKHASQEYSVLQLTWMRFLVQTALLLALVPPRRSLAYLRTRRPGLQILRAALLLIASLAFFTALRFVPLAQANAIAFVAPLLITALSSPLLGESVGVRRWSAVVVGLLGMVIIIRPGVAVFHWALLMPLVMAIASALYHTTTPLLARSEDPTGTLYFAGIAGSVVLALAMPAVWQTPDWFGWIEMIGLGTLGTIGHFLLIAGFRRGEAAALSPFLYAHLLWASMLGAAFFDEVPDAWTVIGALILVCAGIYVYRREQVCGVQIAANGAARS